MASKAEKKRNRRAANRTGRKRLVDVPRHPNGSVVRPTNLPTPELMARRNFLAGDRAPELTAYPLGILLANGAISQPLHDAGINYSRLYLKVFGGDGLKAVDLGGEPIKGAPSLYEPEAETARLKEIHEILGVYSRRAMDILRDVVVFENPPRFMRPVVPTIDDIEDGRLLIRVLTEIAMFYRMLPAHHIGM